MGDERRARTEKQNDEKKATEGPELHKLLLLRQNAID